MSAESTAFLLWVKLCVLNIVNNSILPCRKLEEARIQCVENVCTKYQEKNMQSRYGMS